MITKTLGGDRIGSGNKMKVSMHNYERSTHDLSYTFRTSMNAGTLVPFMKELGLNGDTFDIDLTTMLRTIPTQGPIFGSFKLQADIYVCPFRLYIGSLHNNTLGVGNNMEKIALPQIHLAAKDNTLKQIAPDSLLAYLGTRGVGYTTQTTPIPEREFECIPILAYYDIFKNYYANKQEKDAYFITKNPPKLKPVYSIEYQERIGTDYTTKAATFEDQPGLNDYKGYHPTPNLKIITTFPTINRYITLRTTTGNTFANTINPKKLYVTLADSNQADASTISGIPIEQIADGLKLPGEKYGIASILVRPINEWQIDDTDYSFLREIYTLDEIPELEIATFPLENIDKCRTKILQNSEIGETVEISTDGNEVNNIGLFEPYATLCRRNLIPQPNRKDTWELATNNAQVGLALKTYQSDLFNNWIQTEWIEKINAASAVSVTNGKFTMDALIIAKRVFNYNNRTAIAGGTFQDWQEVTWGEDAQRYAESPIYQGGMSCNIVFDEVVSSAASGDEPIGTLAGRGNLTNVKGGRVNIHIKEPSYIIGIVSITPRTDYDQGNDWDTYALKTMNDLHKPEFDGLGFQDLIEEQMAYWTTYYENGEWKQKACGKQPAYINYQTNYNKVYGDFCREGNADYMVITRNYIPDVKQNDVDIDDLTTYIDPRKTNYIFAANEIKLSPFWLQIGVEMESRRKMSANIIPNL